MSQHFVWEFCALCVSPHVVWWFCAHFTLCGAQTSYERSAATVMLSVLAIMLNVIFQLFQGRHFHFFLGGQKKFLFFNSTGLLKNWKKQHFICSNLTSFIVPFFLFLFFSLFFSFFLFFLSFFLFFFFLGGGDGPPSPPKSKWRLWTFLTTVVSGYWYQWYDVKSWLYMLELNFERVGEVVSVSGGKPDTVLSVWYYCSKTHNSPEFGFGAFDQ